MIIYWLLFVQISAQIFGLQKYLRKFLLNYLHKFFGLKILAQIFAQLFAQMFGLKQICANSFLQIFA